VLVLDATALAQLSITVIEEFAELERELGDRGVSLWIAALPPSALLTARQSPRWSELDQADRLYPTALTAVRAFRAR
jgi:sulfate permease, SulP family